jgi:hypothetical protein
MKAMVVMNLLGMAPAAAVATHVRLSEPTSLLVSGACLLVSASLLRRHQAAPASSVN